MLDKQDRDMLIKIDTNVGHIMEDHKDLASQVKENQKEVTGSIKQVREDMNGKFEKVGACISNLDNWKAYITGCIAVLSIGFGVYLKFFA